MRRIYFLLPRLESARALVRELREQGMGDDQLHVMARREAGLEGLPHASVADQTDVIPSLRRGLLIGGGVGLLVGLGVAVFMQFSGLMVLAVTVAIAAVGFGIGGWAGGLAGAAQDREPVAEAEAEMGKGAVLVMVDTPEEQAAALERRVLERFPDARIQAEEGPHPGSPF